MTPPYSRNLAEAVEILNERKRHMTDALGEDSPDRTGVVTMGTRNAVLPYVGLGLEITDQQAAHMARALTVSALDGFERGAGITSVVYGFWLDGVATGLLMAGRDREPAENGSPSE